MKVAIVHDYIKEYGGAERVVEAMLETWPEAEVFTAIYSPEFLGPHRSRIAKWRIHTSFLQNFPFKNQLISVSRLIAPWIFKSFNLTKYDVVIVSQAGTYVSPNLVKTNTKNMLITYCHTPPRWLYGYSTAGGWERGARRFIKSFLGVLPMRLLLKKDYEAAQLPNYYIANSKEVAERIKKFYHRDSTIIYPPVDLPTILKDQSLKSYYLAGGRLARPKKIDLAIMACTKLNLPLKVFGRSFSGFGKELEKIAGPTVEFLGELSEEEKWKYYSGAKAFLYPSENEDFGIQAVEAMAAGTPVIAYRSGGVVESVVEDKTGVFFNEPTVESLSAAIKKFEKMKFNSEDCINQAKKFSKERFKKEVLQFVNQHAGITRS